MSAKYTVCPDCGANLDYGEKCDCKKEGLPRGNGNSPNVSGPQLEHNPMIAQKTEKVNGNPLRDLRITKNIPAKDMVDVVKALYSKYDKQLQSKCEHGDEYGIDLKTKAMDALLEKYAPELLAKEKHRRDGGHRLKCKVSCRLEDDDYAKLIKYIKDDGFDTMQSWLTWVVRNYLRKKARKESNNGQV